METVTSKQLELKAIYTRENLRTIFKIHDATIKNGIFRPRGYDSVWLFITERKTSDRFQYADSLDGQLLHMEGQLKGRTDFLIVEHRERNLELLVFHRKAKYEHPGAGFRYEGAFIYQSHSGGHPTSFILRRDASDKDTALAKVARYQDTQGAFDPTDIRDARERTTVSIVRRRGQPRFRQQLLESYQSRCAVTGCSIEPILEAAHIHPYLGKGTNVVSNGLLLRTDIHTLFDLGLLWIDPQNFCVRISKQLMHSEYAFLDGKYIILPENELDYPSRPALEFRIHFLQKGMK